MAIDDETAKRLLALETRVVTLEGYRIAARTLICHLVFSLAKDSNDPDTVLKEISEIGDRLLGLRTPETAGALQGAESIRSEIDWIVQGARGMFR